MELTIKRGDIYYAELNPVIGSEQGGTRPVLIISNDIGNKHSPTVIIAPITSRVHTKAKLPTHTLIKDFDGLDKNSIILFEQIRTIDKQRLREYLGTLDRRFIHCADKALAISIGLAKKGLALSLYGTSGSSYILETREVLRLLHREFVYVGDPVPELNEQEHAAFLMNIQKSILLSLEKRKLLTHSQRERCLVELEKQYSREPKSRRRA